MTPVGLDKRITYIKKFAIPTLLKFQVLSTLPAQADKFQTTSNNQNQKFKMFRIWILVQNSD
jgi:hypothetical protein